VTPFGLDGLPGYDDRCLAIACPGAPALPAGSITFRAQPEDFVVEEIPAYLPQGSGEHLYVRVEKRAISTRALVQALCASFHLDERDVGYAGQKDERAIAVQWLSLPVRKVDPAAIAIDGVRVLEAKLHNNKLRLGHLRGNTFTIRLACTAPVDVELVRARTGAAIPNLFGVQRFGRENRTLDEARRFLARTPQLSARSRKEKFWVSAVQSALFNAWLADRVQDGTWGTPLVGDVLEKTVNGAPFWCEDPVADGARAAAGEVVVAGPLVGAGLRPARLEGLTAESRSWARIGVDVAALSLHRALDGGARRPAVLTPTDTEVTSSEGGLTLRFSLPKGAYASVVLRAWFGASVTDAAFSELDSGGA
jgi:tRNA pseudouridine13 synthase